jgi:tetratricopeptide (TPR) repeat protein
LKPEPAAAAAPLAYPGAVSSPKALKAQIEAEYDKVEALKKKGDLLEAYRVLHKIYQMLQGYKQTEEYYLALINLGMAIGDLNFDLRNPEEAISYLKEAFDIYPEFTILRRLCILHLELKQYPALLEICKAYAIRGHNEEVLSPYIQKIEGDVLAISKGEARDIKASISALLNRVKTANQK